MDVLDYLGQATKSLFRFEALQIYNITEENLDDDSSMEDWWQFVKEKTSHGVMMQRVRFVKEPETSYIQRELETHKKTALFGDNIYVLKDKDWRQVISKDFWIIDDKLVLIMNYSDMGEYLDFEVVKEVGTYRALKEQLLKHSSPLVTTN